MKHFAYLIVCLCFLLISCNDDSNSNSAIQSYKDSSGTYLNISSCNWYLTTDQWGGGMVHLKFTGITNGDKMTVRTSGDGVLEDVPVTIDNHKSVSPDLAISFSVTAVPKNSFTSSSLVQVYRGNDTLKVTLNSGNLHY